MVKGRLFLKLKQMVNTIKSLIIVCFEYILLLYSLCMKFQAEPVKFQAQFENRVLCKTFPSRQNSEVQPSVTTHEELKNVFE